MTLASIIILTWQGMRYLDACLTAVFNQELRDFEVIVVDNGSTDGSPEYVAARFPMARLIRNQRNLGFAAGNNIGLRAARGDLLVLLNQDTVVRPEWLSALSNTATEIGGPCVIGCKILYPDGSIQHAGGYLDRPDGPARHAGNRELDHGQWDQMREVEFVTGAALAITRSAFNLIGELDEDFGPAYYEDIDWCLRAHAGGVPVLYQPKAGLVHFESSSMAAGSYLQHLNYHRARIGCVLKHWPAEQMQAFVDTELVHSGRTKSKDDAIARARAYIVNVSRMHRIMRKREQLYAGRPAMRMDDSVWDGVAEGLLDAREIALQHASQAAMPLADLPIDEDVQQLEALAALEELAFTSDVPLVGRLIVAFRLAWYGVAARWAVHHVVRQQRQFNQQAVLMLRSMYQLKRALIDDENELADQLRRADIANDQHSPGSAQP